MKTKKSVRNTNCKGKDFKTAHVFGGIKMVAMDSDDDYVIQISPLTALNLARTKPHRCIFVDCRSFLAYNVAHIRDSLNIHCPPILKRRLQRGSATLSSLLTCPESKLAIDEAETLIYYDEETYDWDEIESDTTIRIVATLLQRERKRSKHFFLKGGFQRFSTIYPSMCEFVKPHHYSSSQTSPLALKLKSGDARRAFSPRFDNDPKKEKYPCKEDSENEPVDILPYLYLGSEVHASRFDILQHLGITSIMNISRNIPNYFQGSFEYKNIPVDDTYNADIESWFEETAQFIDNVKNSGGRVLVHCQAGISRSATICLAYLIGRLRFRLDEAYEFVKKRRSIISPNFNFMGQLLKWESVNQSARRMDDLKTPVANNSNYGFFNFSSLPCGSEIVPNSRSPGLVTTPI